ncbi:MAG: MXAN_6577-like cysteine-rich protein [bacterium]
MTNQTNSQGNAFPSCSLRSTAYATLVAMIAVFFLLGAAGCDFTSDETIPLNKNNTVSDGGCQPGTAYCACANGSICMPGLECKFQQCMPATSKSDAGVPPPQPKLDAGKPTHENTAFLCSNGLDDDNDGYADCMDLDCRVFAFCTPDAGTPKPTPDASPTPDAFACQSGLTNCYGKCVDTNNNPSHCGVCYNACAVGQFCQTGKCVITCSLGYTKCSGGCVDATTDNKNCGACTNACKVGEACVSGSCQIMCGTGTSQCSGSCVDMQNNPSNCGKCGNACATGWLCVAGTCANVSSFCGDGLLDSSKEECDLKIATSKIGACPTTCASASECWFSYLSGSVDICSAKCQSKMYPDGTPCKAGICKAGICTSSACGDGKLDPSVEFCDPGISSGTGACPTTCDDNNPCTYDYSQGSSTSCTTKCTNVLLKDGTPCGTGLVCSVGKCITQSSAPPPASCGDGKLDPSSEKCDTAISSGIGVCPTACANSECMVQYLEGKDCTAECKMVILPSGSKCTGGFCDGKGVCVLAVENTVALCKDGKDNDGDGLADCNDQDCKQFLICAPATPDAGLPPDSTPPADSGLPPDASCMGKEKCPCYGNGTCNGTLKCYSGVCVKVPDSGVLPDSSSPDAGMPDSMITPDSSVVDGGITPSLCKYPGGCWRVEVCYASTAILATTWQGQGSYPDPTPTNPNRWGAIRDITPKSSLCFEVYFPKQVESGAVLYGHMDATNTHHPQVTGDPNPIWYGASQVPATIRIWNTTTNAWDPKTVGLYEANLGYKVTF